MSNPAFRPQTASESAGLTTASPRLAARYGSFDIFRALGAFGVVLIHVGLICDNHVTPLLKHLQDFFQCAVPFFLVTAFFFAARREKRAVPTPWREFIAARANRLLGPFIGWGVIYVLLRAAVYIAGHQREKLATLVADPVGLLFSGGAVMLYFLPLLFIGMLELRCFAPWLKRLSLGPLLGLLAATLALKITMEMSGNAFSLLTNQGFVSLSHQLSQHGLFDLNAIPPLRFALVCLSHALRCAPLIVFVFLVLHLNGDDVKLAPKTPLRTIFLLLSLVISAVYIGFCGFGGDSTPPYLTDIAGMATFLLSLVLLDTMPSNAATSRLGAWTFGIYLCHQVILTVWKFLLAKHLPNPVGLPIALTLTLLTFLIALGLTALAARGGSFSRRLFAVES